MNKTQKIVLTSMLMSLAVVISLIMKLIPILQMPQGGSFSLAMLPLFLIAFILGPKYGLLGAVTYGLLNYFLDGYGFHWASIFLDYAFAFGVIGFAGFFKSAIRGNKKMFVLAIILCSFIRFCFHVVAGMLAWETEFIASIIYNGPYMLASTLGVIVVGLLIYNRISNYIKTHVNV